MSNNGYVSYKNIADYLGVVPGDSLHVASDIRSILVGALKNREVFNIHELIDGFQKCLGNEGTLIFPTFNWDFCGGKHFDYHKTRGQTGSLGQAALERDDFSRTQHPIYSFAVWGKDREVLCRMENKSGFGPDSPFGYLHRCAKGLSMGVDLQRSLTFCHYVEERVRDEFPQNVFYRYIKEFTADYTGPDGQTHKKTYSMLVRDLNLDVDNAALCRLESFLEESGTLARSRINETGCLIYSFSEIYPIIWNDIVVNKGRMICSYIGQD